MSKRDGLTECLNFRFGFRVVSCYIAVAAYCLCTVPTVVDGATGHIITLIFKLYSTDNDFTD